MKMKKRGIEVEEAMEMMKMKKRRIEVEAEGEDRLTDLPDHLLLHVLSFISLQDCVRTSVLSRRWMDLWKMLPVLDFSSYTFSNYKLLSFDAFVDNVLKSRDDSSFSIERITFNRGGVCSAKLLKKVQDFAVSHNVKRLDMFIERSRKEFCWPASLSSSSDSLRHLALKSSPNTRFAYPIPGQGCFKKLTDLHLRGAFITESEPFSRFQDLENLTLEKCYLSPEVGSLIICCPNLLSLTVSTYDQHMSHLSLETPKLKFIKYEGRDFPLLKPHHRHDHVPPVLDTVVVGFNNLHYSSGEKQEFDNLLVMLWRLRSARSLTLLSPAVELLSKFPDELAETPSYFCNLKSLNLDFKHSIFPDMFESILIPSDVTACLLKNSPVAYSIPQKNSELTAKLHDSSAVISYLLKNSTDAELLITLDRFWGVN